MSEPNVVAEPAVEPPSQRAYLTEHAALELKTQRFFAGLAGETRAPHYGDHARDFVRILLQRAEKAGLFTPEQP